MDIQNEFEKKIKSRCNIYLLGSLNILMFITI